MSEPGSLYRLSVLEERWRSDRSPRVFLQLADELRRAGQTGRAIEVLRDGLAWRPESVSGWVALGRILLDEDDSGAAIAALEQAIERDPTQLVANRLLTEAWIRVGDAEKARASLERSRLLSLPDEDFEALQAGIRGLDSDSAEEPAAPHGEEVVGTRPARPFVLPAPEALPVIDLGRVAPGRRGWVSVAIDRAPFAELLDVVAPPSPSSLDSALRREGIFDARPSSFEPVEPLRSMESSTFAGLSETAEAEAEVAPSDVEGRVEPPIGSIAAPIEVGTAAPEPPALEPSAPLEPVFEPLSIGEEVERETFEAVAEIEVDAASSTSWASADESPARSATATLGALYLAQGHLDEAESEYRKVLAERPGDPGAIAGLQAVADRRGATPEADRSPREGELPMGLTARKLAMLRGLHDRLRARRLGGRASVS